MNRHAATAANVTVLTRTGTPTPGRECFLRARTAASRGEWALAEREVLAALATDDDNLEFLQFLAALRRRATPVAVMAVAR